MECAHLSSNELSSSDERWRRLEERLSSFVTCVLVCGRVNGLIHKNRAEQFNKRRLFHVLGDSIVRIRIYQLEGQIQPVSCKNKAKR